MFNTVVSQLEKALACDDDNELRLRIEVLLDIIKDQKQQSFPQGFPQGSQQAEAPRAYQLPTEPVEMKQPRINGPGAIVSGGEHIQYKRPEGT